MPTTPSSPSRSTAPAGTRPRGARTRARPEALTDGAYWVDLTRRAEAGVVDLVTFEDSFGVPADPRDDPAGERTDRVRVRLDAELVAARVAPATQHVGLVPVVTTIHTEPFHVVQGARHARPHEPRPGGLAGAGLGADRRDVADRAA